MALPNVIIFGESGAGKSSCVNMLEGDIEAKVSNRASSTTFTSICYEKTISDLRFRAFDTVGLDETTKLAEKPHEVINGLRGLINQLDKGVNLLVYVMRAPRIKETAKQNYDMFYDGLCKKRVPIVIVITGLEEEADKMDSWWENNKEQFRRNGMTFCGFACITATRGKLKGSAYPYEVEYGKSKEKLQKLIYDRCLRDPWAMPSESWLETVSAYARSNIRIFHDGVTTAAPIAQSRNVIMFGDAGVGKSSIINMLHGHAQARVSDQAEGVTFKNTPYEIAIFNSNFRIFDTCGLNEGGKGTVKAPDAIKALYGLICQLQDGIHLLVFVMQAPRISESTRRNYELFFDVFVQKKVPIVLVVMKLENRENMDEWWKENKAGFDRYGMKFDGHACITAVPGGRNNGVYMYQKEYDESRKKVEQLINGSCSQVGWKMEQRTWFITIVDKVIRMFETTEGLRIKLLSRALHDYGGIPKQEATAEAKKIEAERLRHVL
jgi:predicted GTPase